MKDFMIFLGGMLLITTTFVGGVVAITNWYGDYQCTRYAEITGVETKWNTFDICYIKTDSGWQRWDEYKIRHIAKDSLQ